mmetsp:Transcript_78521/g.220076  ORF Transcript_78521/g.220076 Transcript_78521/m.220076 type:complete len:141 (-) Transcript_78521:329-751(-)
MPAGPSSVRKASAAALPAGLCPEFAYGDGAGVGGGPEDIGDERNDAEPTGEVLTMLPALPPPRAFGDGAAAKVAPRMPSMPVGEAQAGIVLAVGVRAEASVHMGPGLRRKGDEPQVPVVGVRVDASPPRTPCIDVGDVAT